LDDPVLLAFADYVEFVADLSDATRECYLERVRFLSDISSGSVDRLTEDDLRRYLVDLRRERRLSIATINGRLRVFKVFFSWCQKRGYRADHPAVAIKPFAGENLPTEVMERQDILRLIRSFPTDDFYGCRNRAIVMVLYDSMIRVGELLRLQVDDIYWKGKRMVLRETKSHRPRLVPFSDRTRRQLAIWVYRIRQHTPGECLFCQKDGAPISYHGLMSLLKRKQRLLDIKLWPHLFRHSGATHYLEDPEASLATLSEILGHSDPRFTYQRYIHLTGEAVSRHHERFSPVNSLFRDLHKGSVLHGTDRRI
jgi:integrase/recombinase XerD